MFTFYSDRKMSHNDILTATGIFLFCIMISSNKSNRKPKKILNDPSNSVREFIEGLLLQYPNKLVALRNHNGILTAQSVSAAQRVLLISGGGSGHEPSHAGWISSYGMLNGAVCGGIFASPSVASILATIVTLAKKRSSLQPNGDGILLIVKNYTGDRLNFGVAAERATQEYGIPTAMVVVADDCAIPRTKGITGARGVAGTVLIHKIAGSAASTGLCLSDVVHIAKRACSRMGSIGVALDAVTVPGADAVNSRLDDENIIELGLGIHGEAGMRQAPLMPSDELAHQMITAIQSYGRVDEEFASTQKLSISDPSIVPLFDPADELVVLVNNLGGTSNFEMSILARSCVRLLESSMFGCCVVRRLFVGSYMTSFDMHGASLTILNITHQPDILKLLDEPTDALAWKECDFWSFRDTQRPSDNLLPDADEATSVPRLELPTPPMFIENFESNANLMLDAVAQELISAEQILTQYDVIVGDGDCGITFKRGAKEILDRLSLGTLTTTHPVVLFAGIADAISASMGGTSGILLELMFRKICTTLSRCERITATTLSEAFNAGVEAVSLYGGAHVGSRTMLDALVPAASALKTNNDLNVALAEAQAGVDRTAEMATASAGRSNYLSESTLRGTPDPGAAAVTIAFSAMTKALLSDNAKHGKTNR
jgi:triose/dihydroxyacetone kinase / FAD-AMP lyase (cyclizing)